VRILAFILVCAGASCRCDAPRSDAPDAAVVEPTSRAAAVASAAPALDCSEACRQSGLCAPEAGSCVAVSEEDCRRSARCERFGHCQLIDGVCAAGGDDDCQRSKRCSEFGQCVREGKLCVAKTAAHCRASLYCERLAQCTVAPPGAPESGKCVASAADCRAFGACRTQGLCSPQDGRCAAASDVDCRASLRCKELGACRHEGGKCVGS
jgi:hypothetical protein